MVHYHFYQYFNTYHIAVSHKQCTIRIIPNIHLLMHCIVYINVYCILIFVYAILFWYRYNSIAVPMFIRLLFCFVVFLLLLYFGRLALFLHIHIINILFYSFFHSLLFTLFTYRYTIYLCVWFFFLFYILRRWRDYFVY